jgi:hypothetical protein
MKRQAEPSQWRGKKIAEVKSEDRCGDLWVLFEDGTFALVPRPTKIVKVPLTCEDIEDEEHVKREAKHEILVQVGVAEIEDFLVVWRAHRKAEADRLELEERAELARLQAKYGKAKVEEDEYHPLLELRVCACGCKKVGFSTHMDAWYCPMCFSESPRDFAKVRLENQQD